MYYVIVPSLNPDEKLTATINSLLACGLQRIILVDDGSDSEHKEPFALADKDERVTLLVHEVNRGKGAAIKTALKYLIDNCPDAEGVITVDGDGQHTPEDVMACIAEQKAHPNCIVLGCRDFNQDDVPARSRFGNKITCGVFRLACGIHCSDTQTGLRAIPASQFQRSLEIEGSRYEYETRFLLEMSRAKVPFREVKIRTVYLEENASSHFHPIRDSFKIYDVIFRFALRFVLSSLASFLVDIIIFTILNLGLALLPIDGKIVLLIATVVARIFSSIFNFVCNRRLVFASNAGRVGSAIRYYCLAIVQVAASYGLVFLVKTLAGGEGLIVSLFKICVDVFLFLISYQIQKRWVFKVK